MSYNPYHKKMKYSNAPTVVVEEPEQPYIEPPNRLYDSRLDNQDLITKAFHYLNSFKRHRALHQIKRMDKEHDKANYHELKMYQLIDGLELALRAVQRGVRELDEGNEENGIV